VLEKLDEELKELAEARGEELEGEFGDVLFVLVNLARFLKVDPEQALRRTNRKFRERFGYVERVCGRPAKRPPRRRSKRWTPSGTKPNGRRADHAGPGRTAAHEPQLPLRLDRPGSERDWRLLQQHRSVRLALAVTHSGVVVAGVFLARAIPAMFAGPVAGVLLDRMDRKRIMIASDLARAVIAAGSF